MKTFLFFLILLPTMSYSEELSLEKINSLIEGGLQTIITSQRKDNNIPHYWKGEWSSIKQNIRPIPYLGAKGKEAHDSNCFTTGQIFNELSSVALTDKKIAIQLADTLNLAFENILTFKIEDNTFSFWHKLELTDKMKEYVNPQFHNLLVYRPNEYELTNNFTARRANVPTDSDDTSLAYTANYYNEKLNQKYPELYSNNSFSANLNVFDEYRDTNRKYSHPINKFVGNFHNTNAFLTWFSHDEIGFIRGMNIEWREEPRIPFGVNDLDCVVNANVLQSLARYNKADSEGSKAACNYIEHAIDKGLSKRCGFYYPSPYYLHYAVAKALDAGAECLQGAAKKLSAELISEQNVDGSWGWKVEPSSDRKKFLEEPVSLSIYAFNSLLTISKKMHLLDKNAAKIHKAAQFISNNAIVKENNSASWHPGVFFSGGGFVRRVLVWTSEAYTTTLAIVGLHKYKNAYYNDHNTEDI